MFQALQSTIFGEYAAEVIFFFFKFGEAMLEPTLRVYIYDSVCLNHFPHSDVCSHLHLHPAHELTVQHGASRFIMYYKLLLNCPAMIMVLFCGAWSDRHGRKLPVMLSCLGTTLAVLMYMASEQVDPWMPFLPLVLVGAAIRGVFGRSAVMTMLTHSYVSDHSAAEQRTSRLSGLVATSHFGYLFGSMASGVCIDRFGFAVVFLVVIVFQAFIAVVAFTCMRDEVPGEGLTVDADLLDEEHGVVNGDGIKRDEAEDRNEKAAERSKSLVSSLSAIPSRSDKCSLVNSISVSLNSEKISEARQFTARRASNSSAELLRAQQSDFTESSTLSLTAANESTSLLHKPRSDVLVDTQGAEDSTTEVPCGCMRRLFDSFNICMRPGNATNACPLLIVFLILYIQQANKSGETDVLLLFSMRASLSLGKAGYGYMLAATYASLGCIAIFVPRFLSWANISAKDTTLALIGSSFKLISLALLAFSNTKWMLFVAVIVCGPQSLTISSAKSMISKLSTKGDQGKAYSLLSSGETLANLIGTIFYTNLYAATLPVFPGFTFLVELAVYAVVLLMFLYLAINCCRSAADVTSSQAGCEATSEHIRRESIYVSP